MSAHPQIWIFVKEGSAPRKKIYTLHDKTVTWVTHAITIIDPSLFQHQQHGSNVCAFFHLKRKEKKVTLGVDLFIFFILFSNSYRSSEALCKRLHTQFCHKHLAFCIQFCRWMKWGIITKCPNLRLTHREKERRTVVHTKFNIQEDWLKKKKSIKKKNQGKQIKQEYFFAIIQLGTMMTMTT